MNIRPKDQKKGINPAAMPLEVGVLLPTKRFPDLPPRLSSIDPQGASAFNREMEGWRIDLMEYLKRLQVSTVADIERLRSASGVRTVETTTGQFQYVITRIAAENISALKCVTVNTVGQFVISAHTPDKAAVTGVSITSAITGIACDAVLSGEITDNFFTSFPVGAPIYLAANGSLTTIAPVTGAMVRVGIVTKQNTIYINPEPPIML